MRSKPKQAQKFGQEQAMKFDGDKPRVDLVEPGFILGVADVLTYGAEKYGENNWKQGGIELSRFYAAAMRHLLAFREGELDDPESGLSHLLHASTNLMILDYYMRNPK